MESDFHTVLFSCLLCNEYIINLEQMVKSSDFTALCSAKNKCPVK